MKIGEIISDIQNSLKSVNQDEWISRRFVFNLLNSYMAYFTRQEELWKILRSDYLFLELQCIEMEEKLLVSCCNVNILNCNTVMRSKNELLELISLSNGLLIEVYNIEGDKYTKTTLKGYKKLMSGEFKLKDKYFFIQNNYIIIPNSEVEIVTIRAIFQDKIKAKKMDSCSEYNTPAISSVKGYCPNLLDEEFTCPKHLEAIVKEKVISTLMNSLRRINSDENLNINTNLK